MQRHGHTLHFSDKIISLANLDKTLEKITGQSIVLAGGCFDILHFGHLTFLTQAKQEGDILVVLLESDEFMIERKNKKPVHTQDQRAAILASLEQVDYVVLLPHLKTYEEYSDIIKRIKPGTIAVSEGDSQIDLKKKHASHIGAHVKEVTSLLKSFSTSNIRKLYETFPGH